MAESFPEHSVEYLLLREHLKKYARDLLDECGNSPDVEELLEDTGGSDQGTRDSLFDEALCKEQKRLWLTLTFSTCSGIASKQAKARV